MAKETGHMSREDIMRQLPDDLTRKSSNLTEYKAPPFSEPESTFQMAFNKFKKNPLVPIGLAGTVYFLTRGIMNMGNRGLSQKMMRGRVMAQGFTILALLGGFVIEANQRKSED